MRDESRISRIPDLVSRISPLATDHGIGDTLPMDCPFKTDQESAYYGSYLAVDQASRLAGATQLIEGKLHAHDEMLFIIVHQTYELWFKQILHELKACCEVPPETLG